MDFPTDACPICMCRSVFYKVRVQRRPCRICWDEKEVICSKCNKQEYDAHTPTVRDSNQSMILIGLGKRSADDDMYGVEHDCHGRKANGEPCHRRLKYPDTHCTRCKKRTCSQHRKTHMAWDILQDPSLQVMGGGRCPVCIEPLDQVVTTLEDGRADVDVLADVMDEIRRKPEADRHITTDKLTQFKCGHLCCTKCSSRWKSVSGATICPLCRKSKKRKRVELSVHALFSRHGVDQLERGLRELVEHAT